MLASASACWRRRYFRTAVPQGRCRGSLLESEVIPGRCEASSYGAQLRTRESRDSGSGPSDHPGMTAHSVILSISAISSAAVTPINALCDHMQQKGCGNQERDDDDCAPQPLPWIANIESCKYCEADHYQGDLGKGRIHLGRGMTR